MAVGVGGSGKYTGVGVGVETGVAVGMGVGVGVETGVAVGMGVGVGVETGVAVGMGVGVGVETGVAVGMGVGEGVDVGGGVGTGVFVGVGTWVGEGAEVSTGGAVGSGLGVLVGTLSTVEGVVGTTGDGLPWHAITNASIRATTIRARRINTWNPLVAQRIGDFLPRNPYPGEPPARGRGSLTLCTGRGSQEGRIPWPYKGRLTRRYCQSRTRVR